MTVAHHSKLTMNWWPWRRLVRSLSNERSRNWSKIIQTLIHDAVEVAFTKKAQNEDTNKIRLIKSHMNGSTINFDALTEIIWAHAGWVGIQVDVRQRVENIRATGMRRITTAWKTTNQLIKKVNGISNNVNWWKTYNRFIVENIFSGKERRNEDGKSSNYANNMKWYESRRCFTMFVGQK